MRRYKILCWGYSIAGVDGATTTGPTNDPAGGEFADGTTLFDLDRDPTESTDVAKAFPEVVARMLARLKELALTSVEPMQWEPPYQGEGYFCASCPLRASGDGPAVPWAPWL